MLKRYIPYVAIALMMAACTNDDVEKHGGHVVIKSEKKRIYRLTGTCEDGSVKIYSDKKYGIILDGLHLTNPNGAAINLQKSIVEGTGKRCYLMIAGGTDNVLTDGMTYTNTVTGEDEKGCIFSEGKLLIGHTNHGTSTGPLHIGKLTVNAYGKNAIACDDYVYCTSIPTSASTPGTAMA